MFPSVVTYLSSDEGVRLDRGLQLDVRQVQLKHRGDTLLDVSRPTALGLRHFDALELNWRTIE